MKSSARLKRSRKKRNESIPSHTVYDSAAYYTVKTRASQSVAEEEPTSQKAWNWVLPFAYSSTSASDSRESSSPEIVSDRVISRIGFLLPNWLI